MTDYRQATWSAMPERAAEGIALFNEIHKDRRTHDGYRPCVRATNSTEEWVSKCLVREKEGKRPLSFTQSNRTEPMDLWRFIYCEVKTDPATGEEKVRERFRWYDLDQFCNFIHINTRRFTGK